MKNLWLAVSALVMLNACIENSDPEPLVPFDETNLVRTGGWVLTSEWKQTENSNTDLFLSKSTCVQDNLYQFRSDNTYTIEEGDLKCSDANPTVIESGTWEINTGMLTLIDQQNDTTSYTLDALTEQQLKYSFLELGVNGAVASKTTFNFQPTPQSIPK